MSDMGHLDGDHERDVRVKNSLRTISSLLTAPTLVLDQSSEQSAAATLACLHSHILVREGY